MYLRLIHLLMFNQSLDRRRACIRYTSSACCCRTSRRWRLSYQNRRVWLIRAQINRRRLILKLLARLLYLILIRARVCGHNHSRGQLLLNAGRSLRRARRRR